MKRVNILFVLLFFMHSIAFSQEMNGDVENNVLEDFGQNEQGNITNIIETDKELEEINEEKKDSIVKRIDLPHRIFEIGYSVDVDVSNNYFNAADFLKEHLVIDFTEISNKISKKGLSFNFNVTPQFFINLNLKNGFHFNITTGVESYGEINIGKGLFDFLGKGNELNKVISCNLGVEGDVFAYIGTAFGMNIGDFHFEVMPSLYMPILHAQANNARARLTNNNDGYTSAKASATLELYTFSELDSLTSFNTETILENLKNGWGFDFYSSLEHPILQSLVGKIYSRIPIYPGKLSYVAKTDISAEIEIEQMTSLVSDLDSLKKDFNQSDFEYGTASHKIHRPLKIGTEVAWRPFGKWCVFNAMIGMGMKHPFTSDFHAYFEYNFSASADLFIKNWDMLGIQFSTGYINEVFIHSLALTFNLRAIELDVGVSSSAGSFAPSLKLAGAGAYVSISFGW